MSDPMIPSGGQPPQSPMGPGPLAPPPYAGQPPYVNQQPPYVSPQTPYGAPTYQGGYGVPVPAAPQRNTLVFVVSIIMIVGAAINLFGAIGLVALMPFFSMVGLGGLGGITIALCFIMAVVELVGGILGVKNAAHPEKAGLLVNMGIGFIALAVIIMIFNIILTSQTGSSFSATPVVGLLLPILFVVGANQMKKQA